ncbi:ABC transporter permease [Staphylococcus simiae]|uniref:ABC transporter permease n=1 Tax=Staphylococcus simiae TaxID=308354 RepID=UPI003D6D700A
MKSILLYVISIALLAILWLYTYYHPVMINTSAQLQPPSLTHHLLGTDQLGRDLLSRLIIGSAVTLLLTAIVIILSVVTGLLLGLISGIVGRFIDVMMMFIADMLLVIPSFIIALIVLTFVNDSIVGLMVALTIGWLGRYLRYFRNLTRDIITKPFIIYAPLSGYSKIQTTFFHIIPNLTSNVLALVSADFGKIMLSISGLAFLGLGIKPPTPELGTILFDGKSFFNSAPWLFFFPGLLLGGYAYLCQMIHNNINQ